MIGLFITLGKKLPTIYISCGPNAQGNWREALTQHPHERIHYPFLKDSEFCGLVADPHRRVKDTLHMWLANRGILLTDGANGFFLGHYLCVARFWSIHLGKIMFEQKR